MFVRLLAATVLVCCANWLPAADALPRFTEEREAAALHFVRKQCPEQVPLLEELKKSNRATYEDKIRETFQITELLADLQEDPKRYELELKIWKAENKAIVLVAKLATLRDDDRRLIEEQLKTLAKELVDLELLSLEHRVEVLTTELTIARDELTKARDSLDRTTKEKYDSLIEKARKKRGSG
jgi:hypothetical protein